MKKFSIAIFSIMVLVVSVFFAGCGETPEEKEIRTVAAQGLRDAYYVTETIDFSSVNLLVTYSDGSSETLTRGEVDLENAADRNSETQFILYTSGLSTAEPREEGNYPITCLIVGEETTRSLMTIEIRDDMSLAYDLAIFADPNFVQTYKDNYADATNSGSVIGAEGYLESAFMVTSGYTVGNDNEFIYKPTYTLFRKNSTDPVEANINVEVEVRENNNLVGSNVYTFNNDTYGFTFTDDAIGHTYTITMSPSDWDLDELLMNESTFTVTVQDGWNVYNALDLGRINLFNEENIDEIDFANYYKMSVRNIFYDPETFAGSGYGNIKYYELWEEFLTEKGLTNLTEINGVYIHSDIVVTDQDIPSEYFISSEETSVQSAVGTIRDFAFLYSHYILTDFTVNGNLFSIDLSGLRAGMSYASNDDAPLTIYSSEADFTEPGHSTVFAFIGYEGGPTATLCNLDARGNMSTAYSADPDMEGMDAVGAAGSLIFVKSIFGETYVDNIISKEFLISLYMEGETGLKTMDVSNSKVFDCFNSGIFSFGSDNNTVTNSHLERFGGPVMFLISRAGNDNELVGSAGVTVDASSKLESMVEGTEGWFAITGGDLIAASIKSTLDTSLNKYGATILHDNATKFNLITLVMDSEYLNSNKTSIYGSYKYGDRAEFDTANSQLTDKVTAQTPAAFLTNDNNVLSMGQFANQQVLLKNGTPVLPESMSDVAGSYGLETYNLATSGDYINLLYRTASTSGTTTIGAVLGLTSYTA